MGDLNDLLYAVARARVPFSEGSYRQPVWLLEQEQQEADDSSDSRDSQRVRASRGNQPRQARDQQADDDEREDRARVGCGDGFGYEHGT